MSLKVIVRTRPCAPADWQKPSESKQIDWNNASDRKWLTNHLHWAMHNQHAVAIMAVTN